MIRFLPDCRAHRFFSQSGFVLLLIGEIVFAASGYATTPKPIFPKALRPGDTIMIVAPAKYLDEGRVSLAKQRLEAMGFKVRLPENLFRKHRFLSGTDEQRASELMNAFADPEVDAIFPGTGGYGTTRIVDKLDYDLIRRNPKVFIGFSDITGLHIAINQKTGLVTFHSPNPEFGLGSEANLSPLASRYFWRALLADHYGGADSLPAPKGYRIEVNPSVGGKSEDSADYDDVPRVVTIAPGNARGRLIGGNLSVLHALMGSSYEIETDGKILFLEDIGEAPYRVDRMLSTLRLAGKFDEVRGIILGAFTARKGEDAWDDDASMNDVLRDYFDKLAVPVIANFPAGHVRENVTLPIGALVELNADQQTLKVLENPTKVSH